MKKRFSKNWQWFGLVGVCGLAVAAFLSRDASRKEPQYKGKPVSYWVEQALVYEPDPADVKFRNFLYVLARFRSETIREIVKMIERHRGDSFFKRWYLRVLPTLPVSLQQKLPKPRLDRRVRELGLWDLVGFTRQSSPTGPTAMRGLLALLRNPNASIRAETAASLGNRSSEGSIPGALIAPDPALQLELVHALAEATEDPSGQVRWNSVKALAALRPVSDEAVSALIAALDDREVRRIAALSLADLHRGAPAAVPVLIEEMKKEDAFGPKSMFIEALGRYGPEAEAAMAELRLLLQHRDPRIREAADKVLKKIQPPEETRRA